MKKLAILLTLIFPIFVLSSCDDDFEEITEVYLSAVLTPTSTSASVSTSDGYTITFTWTNANHATQYLLEIYQFDSSTGPSKLADVTDDLIASTTPVSVTVEASDGSTTSYVYESEPDAYYYARVKGQNTDDANQDDSGWAVFPYPIETYAVMDALPTFEATERTSSSITVAWTLADGDEEGVTEIRVTPDPDGGDSYKAYSVSEGATSVTIDGLSASTMYTLKANYYSATRYSINAWTKPVTDGYTTVSDTASFHQAITDQASKIILAYADTAYYMGEMKLTADLSIIGESLADGTKPTILGHFAPQEGVTNLHIEDLTFDGSAADGTKYDRNVLINWGATPTTARIESIEVVNCNIYSFKQGVLYLSASILCTSGIGNVLFDSVYCEDIQGSGGEGIDFRNGPACTIDDFTLKNSTFTDGFRSFLRIDASYTVTKLTITNNTLNYLCTSNNSNNNGLFSIRSTVGEFTITNNLILNMSSTACSDNNHYYVGQYLFNTNYPISSYTVSNNYWYNLYGTDDYPFFNSYFTQAIATTNGAILDEDPCYNSERGIFNVTNSTVSAAKVGDPRYLIDYVVPEDDELVPVEYGYVWDLTDSGVFDDTVEETHVRGNLQFIVTSNPINMVSEGQEFSAAATFNNNGTPNDCAIKFLVNQPGAVVLSAVNDGNINNHITVAYGPADGSGITGVAGAAYAGASEVKASMQDIVEGEETAVYIYACGPIILSELSWTKGVVQLDTPAPVLSATTTTGDDVTLSWDTVNGAGSYEVTCTGPYTDSEATVTSVSGTSMTLSGLSFGNYTYTVKAISSNTNDYTDSEASESVTLGVRETTETLGTNKEYSWGAEDFQFLASVFGDGTEVTESFAYNGMYYIGGSNFKFGLDDKALASDGSAASTRVSLGGTGSTTNRTLILYVGGSGTLTVEAGSGSDSSDRTLNYQVGTSGTATTLLTAPMRVNNAAKESVTITADAGTPVYIYSAGSGINVFSVTWTPSEYDPDAATEVESYSWGNDIFEALCTTHGSGVDVTEAWESNGLSYLMGGGKCKFGTGTNASGQTAYRCQFGGTGSVSKNALQFTVNAPGTLTVECVSSNASSDRDLGVAIGDTQFATGTAPMSSSGAVVLTFDMTKADISEGTVISVYSTNSGINVFEITWTGAE